MNEELPFVINTEPGRWPVFFANIAETETYSILCSGRLCKKKPLVECITNWHFQKSEKLKAYAPDFLFDTINYNLCLKLKYLNIYYWVYLINLYSRLLVKLHLTSIKLKTIIIKNKIKRFFLLKQEKSFLFYI